MVRTFARFAALVGLLVVSSTGCLFGAGDTSSISLVSTSTSNGWKFDFYRNSAYPCSISGDQVFTIATKVGSDDAAKAPLWVWMHGGGVGFFDSTGTPQPDTSQMTEESSTTQRTSLLNAGLLARVRSDAAGYRLLAVSYCNRDLYSGTGQVDPNNPNVNGDGSARLTDGLNATKAAITFAEQKYPTSTYVLHGGSAGSVGTYEVAWAQQLSGNPPAGVVADASVLNAEAEAAAFSQGACGKASFDPASQGVIAQRIDPSIANPDNQVDHLVTNGQLTVPLLNIWNHGDVNSCGNHLMTCPLRDGTTATLLVADCEHEPLAEAIDATKASTHSMNLPLCVSTAGNDGKCDKHVVTTSGSLTNTDPSSPADYLATILTWADARVATAS